jgi:hypothetical protein
MVGKVDPSYIDTSNRTKLDKWLPEEIKFNKNGQLLNIKFENILV